VYLGLRAFFNIDVFFVGVSGALHNGFILLQLWIDHARVSFFDHAKNGDSCFARGK
jgi:hypothetical protein